MDPDPIAEAITMAAQAFATVLQQVATRGVELTPTANGGFHARIAPADDRAGVAGEREQIRRAW